MLVCSPNLTKKDGLQAAFVSLDKEYFFYAY